METTERVKFTEGPWGFSEWSRENGKKRMLVIETQKDAIAELYGLYRPQDDYEKAVEAEQAEREANARLIAASPTLYGNAYEAVGLINKAGETLKGVEGANEARNTLIVAMCLLNAGIRAAEGR